MSAFKDRVALITGGGSGINLSFAQAIVQKGCRVVIADLRLHSLAETWIEQLPADRKGFVAFRRTDVTRWKDLTAAMDFCSQCFGTAPDIVVPGAGVYEPSSNSFWEDRDAEEASRYKVLDINLTHPLKLSRMAIESFIKSEKPGCIVHLSSIAGQRSSMVTPLYTASKHAVNSFVRGMGPLEELLNIRVLAVAPGTVGTPLFLERPEAAKYLDMSKDFLLPPEEVANAMVALIEQPDRYPGGTVLEVCDVEGRWRKTSLLNDPGPNGPASFTSRKAEAVEDLLSSIAPGKRIRRSTGNSSGLVMTD